ncbi:MAG: permease [Candidatus Aenigmarchaeota archaeon]|nr:permease [Candidatus Aenigmarchaeota archaeon]
MEDKTDPVCGMKGTIKAHNHYFCSYNCIRKYEKEHNIAHVKECASCDKSLPWYKEKLYVVGLITVVLMIVSYFTLPRFFNAFMDYFNLVWWAILLGLFIGGIIDYSVPREYILKFLSRRKKRTIFYAVGLGFLMSACSHGILAISMELYKKGASPPAVIAFLLASPWANLPITILLFGFFGANALYLIVSAIIIAIVTGFIYQILDKKNKIEKNPNTSNIKKEFSVIKDMKKRFKNHKFSFKDVNGIMSGSWALAKMVVWWILIGMIMAAFARTFVPHDFFVRYMGPTLLGLGVTLLFATIIEVCSEGSSVLAFEIFDQTQAFGNSFTFLMAGVATDYTEIGLIWSNIGKKTALWLPFITVPQILILGYIFNIII